MYIRQNRVKHRLGSFEGELGQVPTQSITIADPVDGAQLTFSGPVNEIAQCQVIIGMVSGAVGAAKNKNFSQAKQVIASAKGILPATGSQRDKASFLVTKAETFIANKEKESVGTSAAEVLTGVGSILAALAPAAGNVLQTQADARTAKLALRAQGQAQPQQQFFAPAPSGGNTGIIIAVVAGIAVIVGVIMMSKKK